MRFELLAIYDVDTFNNFETLLKIVKGSNQVILKINISFLKSSGSKLNLLDENQRNSL